MDEQQLIRALVARADEDARAFREKNPNDTPTERWIENSYTAALPIVKDDVGFDPGHGPHPQLFAAYRGQIQQQLGERAGTRDSDETLKQQPTPGEH